MWMSDDDVEAWQRKELRLLSEHNEQMSQLGDQLHEKDLQIQQQEMDIQVSPSKTTDFSELQQIILEFFCYLILHLSFSMLYCRWTVRRCVM